MLEGHSNPQNQRKRYRTRIRKWAGSKESLASKNAAKVIHKSGLVGMLLWVPLKTHNLLSVVPLPPYAM